MSDTNAPDDLRAKRDLLAQLLQQGRAETAAAVPPPAAPVHREATPAAPPALTYAAPPARRPAPAAARTATRPHAPPRTETGLFTYEQIGSVAVFVVRALALCVLFGSFFGSILAVDGDWKPSLTFWHGINTQAALLGVGLQLEITLVEWWRGANWRDPLYIIHLAADTGLTFLGYWPYVRGALSAMLATVLQRVAETSAPTSTLLILAGGVFLVLCVIAARFPEMVYIKPNTESNT